LKIYYIDYFQPKLNFNRVEYDVKSNQETMVQVRLMLPDSYRRLFKAYCTEVVTDMSKVVAQIIEERLIQSVKLQRTIEETK
jgi:hypothetical protein